MATIAQRDKTHIEPDYSIADVWFDDTMLWIKLKDERVIGSPRSWSRVLTEATGDQLRQWELVGNNIVYFPALDEYISAPVLMGHPS
jgi:hypothetical protein